MAVGLGASGARPGALRRPSFAFSLEEPGTCQDYERRSRRIVESSHGCSLMSFNDSMTSLKPQRDTTEEKVADEAFEERERQHELARQEREQKYERERQERERQYERERQECERQYERERKEREQQYKREQEEREAQRRRDNQASWLNSVKKQLLKESPEIPLEERLKTTVGSPPAANKEETTLKVSSRAEAPVLESVLSAPQKPSLLCRLFGGLFGSCGKKSASFCASPVEVIHTPPNSDEKERIYGNSGAHVPVDILVVAYDLEVYQSWRKQVDKAFARHFEDSDKHKSLTNPKNKKSAMDVLHAARAKRLLRSLDAECLRAVITNVFPNTEFPRLQSKTGESQLESFLEKVDKVLDDHVETTKKTRPDVVDYDSVFYPAARDDYEIPRRQKHELDHSLSDGEADDEMEA